MSNIAYTYVIIKKDLQAKVMELVYSSPGRADMHIGMPLPKVGQSVEEVAAMYAPVANWAEAEAEVLDVQVGVTGGYTPPGVEPTTLGSAKQRKLDQIAEWRYALETAGVNVGGVMVRTDRESQAQLTGAFSSLKEGLVTSIDWKAANGQFVTLTLVDVSAIAQAVAQHVQASFTQEKSYIAQVQAATTIEQVDAITLPPANSIPVTVV